jgi:hypothetical protein
VLFFLFFLFAFRFDEEMEMWDSFRIKKFWTVYLRHVRLFLIVFALPLISIAVIRTSAISQAQTPQLPTANVSGVIRDYGNPVSGVRVEVRWQDHSQSIITLADGTYSVSGVPVGSGLQIEVYPPVSLRLAFRAWQTPSIW